MRPVAPAIGVLRFEPELVKLMTNQQVVQVVEFETTDPALRGEMTITYALGALEHARPEDTESRT